MKPLARFRVRCPGKQIVNFLFLREAAGGGERLPIKNTQLQQFGMACRLLYQGSMMHSQAGRVKIGAPVKAVATDFRRGLVS
jgi:hypothetical protein